jgi:hypothetical protein
MRGARLAYALIAEPAEAAVVAERNRVRRDFATVFERIISAGVRDGHFPPQNPRVSAAMVIGGINEAITEAIDPDVDAHSSTDLADDILNVACSTIGLGADGELTGAGVRDLERGSVRKPDTSSENQE